MRKVGALLLMAIWISTVIYLVFGFHFSDLEKRVEDIRQLRSGWPAVPGSVVDVRFYDADATDENDQSYAAITYQYSVSRILYSSRQDLTYYSQAQKQAIKYYPGQSISVYFDPNDACKGLIEPMNISVLDVSKWWEILLRIFTYPAIILGCIAIWVIIAGNEKPNNLQEKSIDPPNNVTNQLTSKEHMR
jgi:hypothetical protein